MGQFCSSPLIPALSPSHHQTRILLQSDLSLLSTSYFHSWFLLCSFPSCFVCWEAICLVCTLQWALLTSSFLLIPIMQSSTWRGLESKRDRVGYDLPSSPPPADHCFSPWEATVVVRPSLHTAFFIANNSSIPGNGYSPSLICCGNHCLWLLPL